MKKLVFVASLLLSTQAMAETLAPLFKCLVTRSTSYNMAVKTHDNNTRTLVLQNQHFLRGVIAEVELSQFELVNYGDKIIVLANSGKSGYVLAHLAKNADGQLVGRFDIDLYGNENFHANGLRAETYCTAGN